MTDTAAASSESGAPPPPPTTTTTTPAEEAAATSTMVMVKPNTTKRANKLDYLDGLRGYAALTVVIDHFILFFMPSYYASVAWLGLAALAPSFYNGRYRLPSSKAETLVFPFMDGTFSVAIFFVLSGRVLVASYLAKENPPISTIASATIRRLFRLGIPPFFMVLVSWIMDTHGGFKSNARAADVTLSPFGRTDVAFAVDPANETFTHLTRFLVALFTDNDKALSSPLMVTFKGKYTYLTSVLWTLRLEFRASMIVFFVAVVLKAVPPKSRWLIYGALIWWFNMESYHYLLFILGMLLCDLEQTFAVPLRRLVTTRHRPTVACLWALRAALLYAWVAASWWQIRYLDDTPETRLVVGSFSALALLAVSPPLQALFRSRPFHFLGYISFSLYLWHLTVIFSLGSWTFSRLYLDQNRSYAHAVGAAAGASLVVAIAVAFAATKIFDEPSVTFAKWVVDSLFTPYDEGKRVHRALRKAETFAHQQLTRFGVMDVLWGGAPDPKPLRVTPVAASGEEKMGSKGGKEAAGAAASDGGDNNDKRPMARVA